MNFLFYVGIIIPTLITFALFIVFIYCWFLQKARKEVLTKKYDPHGKMRRLGMNMDPPPPPAFCGRDDLLLLENGEDNVAYDVSRSPSTEQDMRGRPLYHTYHDSGISAGLSPSQENEPRPGISYRTCPDSGISGFGPQAAQCSYHSSRECCLADEPYQRHNQQHQMFSDQIHANRYQQQQPYHQQFEQAQAVLHQNLVQASVHPSHGVCYGDDMNHLQSPQHYNPPVFHPNTLNLNLQLHERPLPIQPNMHNLPPHQLLPHPPPRVPYGLGNQIQHNLEQESYAAEEATETAPNNINDPRQENDVNVIIDTNSDHTIHRTIAISPSNVLIHSTPNSGNNQCPQKTPVSISSPNKLPRHSYRDTGAADTCQPNTGGAERPDSQASQSSTTDSEDSGFRSSHCAAHHHHNVRLSKQGNPLLKPLRRTKINKVKCKSKKAAASSTPESSRVGGATPLITLSPQNLQDNMDNSNVIQNTSLMGLALAHRQPVIVQQNSCAINNISKVSLSSCANPINGAPVTFHDDPTAHAHSHSPVRENWPQSTNEDASSASQNIDLNEISTHLSWKYLQDISSSSGPSMRPPSSGPSMRPSSSGPSMRPSSSGFFIQPCHQAVRPGQINQANHDQQMEMFGFSVV